MERLYDQREFSDLTRNDLFLINAAWAVLQHDNPSMPDELLDALSNAAVRFRAFSDLCAAAERRLLDAERGPS
jgi:hypothetical protein